MRTTAILLDRLSASLEKQGVTLKRNQLLETAAMAFGYHNQNEFTAAAKEGRLNVQQVQVVGKAQTDETDLILLKQQDGLVYGIEESFVEQVIENERREIFGPSPYGGLNNLSDIAESEIPRKSGRYCIFDEEGALIERTDDEEYARKQVSRMGVLESYIDCDTWTLHRYRYGYRHENLTRMPDKSDDSIFIAKKICDQAFHIQNLEIENQSLVNLAPDWRKWEKDLKKASHKRKDPISDEDLYRLRLAVADNHCKSSSSERAEVEYREQRYISKHLGALLCRLDQAEEALRLADIAPVSIERKRPDDAQEMISVIEKIEAQAKEGETGLYEIRVVRDGEMMNEIFVADEEEAKTKGHKLVAEYFRMEIDLYEKDGNYEEIEYECDTYSLTPVKLPKTISILNNARKLLNQRYDPQTKSVDMIIMAAINSMIPKPTI